jgi:hypothetical protein
LQRKCACGTHTIAGGDCESCQKENAAAGLRRAAGSADSISGVPSIVHEVLRSPGQPLDASTREFMESHFNHDFSHVRMHADRRAADSARAVNALAYTVGRDVVFGSGRYAPGTSEGRRLLAHELAHVVQQASVSTTSVGRISDYHDPAERDAERAASGLLAEEKALVTRAASTGTLYRRPSSEAGTQPSGVTPCDPAAAVDCASTKDCAAVSVDALDKQPAALRNLLKCSFEDPAAWYADLAPRLRAELAAIFNRLCRYGLLCHVRRILRLDAGEKVVSLLGHQFLAPGSTPSVYFISPSGDALIDALMSTGRFCLASGAGASQHPGQSTLREISDSDSMHISIGPGDQFDAHIDRYSPTPSHPGSSFCPNAPTPAALAHIGREVVPGKVRKITGIPGVQVLPELPPPAPVPPGAGGAEPLPEFIRLTLRGPVKERQRQKSDTSPLPDAIERRLADEVSKRVRPDALVPPSAERRLEAAVEAAEWAGPGEEKALIAAREAARERLESFAGGAHDFALDMARKMAQAQRSGRPDFAIRLGPIYNELTRDERKYILEQIRDIARTVRELLAERAAGVRKVWVAFGDDVMWDIDF